MNNLYFWNNWTKSYRLLYISSFVLLLVSLFFFSYTEYFGKNTGLKWELLTEAKTTKILIDTFQKGFFEFGVEADNQYFFQSFSGTLNNHVSWFSFLILGSIALLLVGGSVTISYTKGIWYFVSLTGLGVFFYLLNLDVLEVFGLQNMYWSTGAFLAFGVLVHYFHAFKPFTPLAIRYGVFAVLTGAFLYTTASFSTVENPLYLLASYGIFAPISIAFLFIVIISTDILSGFLFLTTETRNAKKMSSLFNFLLVSLFFLGNVVLTFLKNRNSIDWKILYLEAPVLLVISIVLGIWAHKKKEPIYGNFVDFSPATAVWFLIMAINCLLCYSYFNLNANDALQEVFEDTVIFSQLCFGIMFLIFVVANFMSLMEQNLPVHVVIYKPRYMPFGFVRIMGVILVFAIVMYNNKYQIRQLQTGYYVGIGEAYIHQNEMPLAQEYLKSALDYDQGNHKANYLLGIITHQKSQDDPQAKVYLKQAMFKKPSPQTYATLGHYFLEDGDIIRSIETLKEGAMKFPKSMEILNNLGLSFSRTDIQDSTFFYLKKANATSNGSVIPMTNQLAFAIKNNIKPELDTAKIPDDITYKTNLLALLNKSNKKLPKQAIPSFLNDTVLDDQKAAYLLNLSFNNLKDSTNFKTEWIDSLLKKPANSNYSEELLLSKSFREYYTGNVSEGITTMDHLCTIGSSPIKYNNIIANWLIEKDAPRVALDFLEKSKNAGDMNASFSLAILTSYFLSGKDALSYWQDPVLRTDAGFQNIVNNLLTNTANIYTIGILPQLFANPSELVKSFNSLPESADKQKALARLMQHLNDINQPTIAIILFDQNPKTNDSEWQYLRALRKTEQKELALEYIQKADQKSSATYIQAWASADVKQKEILFKKALKSDPIYEDGVTDAIAFLETKLSKEAIYDLLLQSVMLNQYSIPLQKAYTLSCVKMNLFSATDYALAKLKDLLPTKEYTAFASEIKTKQEQQLNSMVWK